MQGRFKSETSFEKRHELCSRIRAKYEDRVPIIIEVTRDSQLTLNREKFLVPGDISVGGLLSEIRKQASVRPEEAIFIFCGGGGVLVPTSETVSHIYEKYKDEDGFLYMVVALENTFGALQILDMLTFGVLDYLLKGSSRVSRTLGLGNWL